jgi:hypothetical protein
MFRTAARILLIGFLLWHMFAVAVYSTPRDSESDIATLAKAKLIPFVTPYMYVTSQWQLWDIFAPDPMRRVTSYRIEIHDENGWQELETFGPHRYSFFDHAAKIKLTNNLLSEFEDNRAPFAGRFMHLLCADHSVTTGTPIRLIYRVYILPYLTEPQTMSWWRVWEPTITERVGFTSTCP